jgi:predicted permease
MSAPLLRLLEVLPCLLLGVLLDWRWPKLSRRLSPPLIRYGVPLSVLGMLLRSGLERSMLWAGLLALVGIGAGLALLRWLPGLRRLLPLPALQLGAVAGNSAYFGFPVVMALLPPAAMGTAVAYDLAATLLIWGLGPVLLTGERLQGRPLMRALANSPASRALVLALLVGLTPWSQQLGALLVVPARLVLLLALTILGIHLGPLLRQPPSERVNPWLLWPALTIKLLLFPAAMLALSLLTPLPALARQAVVLQAAAPTAVAVLLLSEASPAGNDGSSARAATLVLWSTAIALGSVPLWRLLLVS